MTFSTLPLRPGASTCEPVDGAARRALSWAMLTGVSGFVGRDEKLAALADAFAFPRAGRGRAVLGTGEPGNGKTALARAFGEVTAEAGLEVVWGRAWPGHEGSVATGPEWWARFAGRARVATSRSDPGSRTCSRSDLRSGCSLGARRPSPLGGWDGQCTGSCNSVQFVSGGPSRL